MKKTLKEYINKNDTIHLIGIGGVSMSALAELLVSLGANVTGSDQSQTTVTNHLETLGIKIYIGHNSKNIDDATVIIRTSAIHDDNPEIIRARSENIEIIERAQAWGEIMQDYKNVICLSGTHGKTTTTSMMTMITMAAKLDPTVMVGSNLPAINGTLRIGQKDYFVAESCEYCNSFHSFHPTVAVVLNLEADHLDFFKDLDEIIESFRTFCLKTPEDGTIIANADDENVMKAVKGINRKCVTFGVENNADIKCENISHKNGYYSFDAIAFDEFYTHIDLNVPGFHNVLNALACCAASYSIGVSGNAVANGLHEFTGSSRRFQLTGDMKCGARVVDDYAHHPSEMRATLNAAKQMDFKRIICIFQPHTYTRTKALFNDFVSELSNCDIAMLAPIYAAREKNLVGISSEDIACNINGAKSFGSLEEIADNIKQIAKDGDLILTMGAGNINTVGNMILQLDS